MNGEHIWLTHLDASEGDEYVKILQELGYRYSLQPLLRIQYQDFSDWGVSAAQILASKALAITSPRAVRAIQTLIQQNAEFRDHLRALPAYCISGKSLETARQAGLAVRECGAKSSLELAGFLGSQQLESPLLFPCSFERRDDLPDLLRSLGLEVLEARSYRTLELELESAQELRERIGKDKPSYIVLFSPSGVRALVKLFERSFFDDIKLIAIGATSAAELSKHELVCQAVCEAPNAQALKEALFLR